MRLDSSNDLEVSLVLVRGASSLDRDFGVLDLLSSFFEGRFDRGFTSTLRRGWSRRLVVTLLECCRVVRSRGRRRGEDRGGETEEGKGETSEKHVACERGEGDEVGRRGW